LQLVLLWIKQIKGNRLDSDKGAVDGRYVGTDEETGVASIVVSDTDGKNVGTTDSKNVGLYGISSDGSVKGW
jgi:hypothetical protein